MKVFSTPKLNNGSLSWVQPDRHPNGVIFDLGNFLKEDVHAIKFELLYHDPATLQDRILGTLDLKTTAFMDLSALGQERCLILTGPDIPYTLLIV